MRVHLVYALSQINDIIAVPFLIEQIDQQEPDVRAAIALALGGFGLHGPGGKGEAMESLRTIEISSEPPREGLERATFGLG